MAPAAVARVFFSLALALVCSSFVDAFHQQHALSRRRPVVGAAAGGSCHGRRGRAAVVRRAGSDNLDKVPDSENVPRKKNGGGQDIDAEWKKLMAGEGQPAERPKDIEVSDFEFAAKKLKSKAVTLQKSVVPETTIDIKVPSWKRLSSDWRFWVGVIVVISVIPGLLGSLSQPASYGGSGGFQEPIDYVVFSTDQLLHSAGQSLSA
jgi:hypothetical protein